MIVVGSHRGTPQRKDVLMADDEKAADASALDVRVEQEDSGWVVVADVDGARKQFGDPHPDKEQAELYAQHMFAGSDRWTDAAEKVSPRPEKYPGDGDPSVP